MDEKNEELRELFANYKNLTEDQITKLIVSIIKMEKESLKIPYPIVYKPGFSGKLCGGSCQVVYNNEIKKHEIAIEIDYPNIIHKFVKNKNVENSICDTGLETLYKLIATICHEMRHAYQKTQMAKKETTSYDSLLWLKEAYVLDHISEDIYVKNHSFWSQENDSYKYMYDRATEYITRYFPVESLTPQQKKSLDNYILAQKRWTIHDDLYIEVGGHKVKLEEYLNGKMNNYIKSLPVPARTDTLLKYEYNPDGSKKTYDELMVDKKKLIDNLDPNDPNYTESLQSIEIFYQNIVNNDKNLLFQQKVAMQRLKTPQELYDEAFKKRSDSGDAIEKLMATKSEYSDSEYRKRLTKLIEERDSAQKQMDKYFAYVYKENNLEEEEVESEHKKHR